MDLSLIIVNYNTEKLLQNCLESIFRRTKGLSFEVWVVDNGSSDGSAALARKLAGTRGNLHLLENSENLGFAAANNRAIKKARGEFLLLLNSDTIIRQNAFKKMIEFARRKPKLGVLGPRLLNADGTPQPSAAPFLTLGNVFLWLFTGDRFLYKSPGGARRVDWVMGSAFLIRKQAVDRIGLLDEQFFMYVEEQEWCFRLSRAGWQTWFYPGAEVYHLVRGSSPEGKQRAILWIFEGLIYFYRKHFAPWQSGVLKFLLRFKAGLAWSVGVLTGKASLKKTYAQAFKLAR